MTASVILKDGSKVEFRRAERRDFEQIWLMLSSLSEESLRFLPHPIVMGEVKNMLDNIDYDSLLPIVATVEEHDKSNVVALATLGFQKGVSRRHRAEFDIIVHDSFQGIGLGTALTQYMIDTAREKGLKKIYLKTATDNSRAIHVYKKLGFFIEGVLKMEHYHHLRNEYGDDYRMAILL